jgi:hypothetical protein
MTEEEFTKLLVRHLEAIEKKLDEILAAKEEKRKKRSYPKMTSASPFQSQRASWTTKEAFETPPTNINDQFPSQVESIRGWNPPAKMPAPK